MISNNKTVEDSSNEIRMIKTEMKYSSACNMASTIDRFCCLNQVESLIQMVKQELEVVDSVAAGGPDTGAGGTWVGAGPPRT